MTDLKPILALWHELETAGTDYVLATIVAVDGSSYRKPGAQMLLAPDGRRAGTVSGGCLEAEVAQRAWWLTASGPALERYSTIEDDGDRPYGSGCGGIISILLERPQTARPLLHVLEAAFDARVAIAIATVLDGPNIGFRSISLNDGDGSTLQAELEALARVAVESRTSLDRVLALDNTTMRVFIDYRPARPGLWVFSAGDDAKPLVHLAQELGWFVAVADGRAHLATRDRFAAADELLTLPVYDLPEAAPTHFKLRSTDAAVVMTHSFDQDSRVLASLLSLNFQLAYIGVLGPQHRTRELLAEAASLLHLPNTNDRTGQWLAQMYAPTGLDLGADTPATIALSILAEIQKTLASATGSPLRQVRAEKEALSL